MELINMLDKREPRTNAVQYTLQRTLVLEIVRASLVYWTDSGSTVCHISIRRNQQIFQQSIKPISLLKKHQCIHMITSKATTKRSSRLPAFSLMPHPQLRSPPPCHPFVAAHSSPRPDLTVATSDERFLGLPVARSGNDVRRWGPSQSSWWQRSLPWPVMRLFVGGKSKTTPDWFN